MAFLIWQVMAFLKSLQPATRLLQVHCTMVKARQQLAALAARLNPGEEVGSSSEDAPPLYAQAEGSAGLPPAWGCDGESSTVQGVAFTSPSAAVRGEPVPQAAPTGPATQDI